MGIPKRHWYHNSEQCKNQHYTGVLSAREFAASAFGDAAYCLKCYRAAVKAIPAEDAKPKRHNGHCTWPGCSSFAINPGHQGRDETSDLSLCDVCYWRCRCARLCMLDARYAELRALVEAWQARREDALLLPGESEPQALTDAANALATWRHR